MTALVSKKENPLGWAPIGQLLGRFAFPAIMALLVSSAYNITDQIFIGNVVGLYGNAATNVAFPTVILTTALAQLLGIGTASNVNLHQGAKEPDKASRYLGNGLFLIPLTGLLLMTLVLILKGLLLSLSGASDQVYPLAQAYLSITSLGIPFALSLTSLSFLIRADGSPTYAMLCTLSGALVNVFLDWLFMYPLGAGIQGAAWATVLGQILSAILSAVYFFKPKTLSLSWADIRPHGYETLQIFRLGLSNFANQAIMMVVALLMNHKMTYYGSQSIYGPDIPLAVSGVVAKVNSILIAFNVGTAQGASPIFSYNKGAGNMDRLKETYFKGLGFLAIMGFIAFGFFQVFPEQIVSIFGPGDPLYFQFAHDYMTIFLFFVFMQGIQPLSVNYFTSTGIFKRGLFLSLSRQGIFFIPALLLFSRLWGLEGILWAGPFADFSASLCCLILTLRNFKEL